MTKFFSRHGMSSEEKEKGVGDEIESELVVQALRLNTLSKLTFSDSSRYFTTWLCFLIIKCIHCVMFEDDVIKTFEN